MTNDRKIKVDITATDDTEKGFAEVDKRARKFEADRAKNAKSIASASKGLGLGSVGAGFGLGEKASGGGSNFGGAATARFRELSSAGGVLKSVFAAAASEGAGLVEGLGAVGMAAGAATGAVIGLAFGAAKLTESWVKGGAALGRLSQGLGISTDLLQKWQGAGERFGVDKDTMAGSLHGIGSTIHEAINGRDQTALSVLRTLGIPIRRNKDGAIDYEAMYSDIADATARQKDPFTQEKIASYLGFSGALPAFRQGSKALKAQTADFEKYGTMLTPSDVGLATAMFSKGVQLRQLGDKGLSAGQGLAARAGAPGMDALLAAGRGTVDGVASLPQASAAVAASISRGAQVIGQGAVAFEHGVEHFAGAVENFMGINRHSLGGRIHNAGNIRPVGGKGFRTFGSDAEGIEAMGRQILRDQNVHGAQTLYDLLAGVVGPDGQRHWGYAPKSDHNDPVGYAREVAAKTGIGSGRFDANDPVQLAAIMSAMMARETGSRVSAKELLPLAQRIVLEVHGLPAGSKVVARSGGKPVAVAHAMASDGP